MKHVKFLSVLLVLSMLISTLASLSVIPVFATETEDEEEEKIIDYMNKVYGSEEEKLADMDLVLDRYGFEMYFEDYTGEVAVKNKATGDVLFTNPYDIAAPMPNGSKSSDNVKSQLLSQLVVNYTENDTELTMYSYIEAAQRGQIKLKNIKDGIRVEYMLGRQETRKLVPRMINATRFDQLILAFITDKADYDQMWAFYELIDLDDPTLTDRGRQELELRYPICTQMDVYVFDENAVEREFNKIESIIKEFCPHYTYETLAEDHLMTDWKGQDQDPVLFRMSLEYYLDESGVSVRLPANGIRFDESNFALNYISILPFMGAGSSEFTGYTMIPDGSGTLVRFEDILAKGSARTLSGKMYGQDYAYHTIGDAHKQIMRLPVYGVVEDRVLTIVEEVIPDGTVTETPAEGDVTEAPADDAATDDAATDDATADDTTGDAADGEETEPAPEVNTYKVSSPRGYVAIIEEGDALATIVTEHGANATHKYNSVYTKFYPRSSDTYNLGSSISISGNVTWTVVSERKYTGSYRIRFIMLTGEDKAEEKGITDFYECSYVGMAKAYRDQLVKQGHIKPLEKTETQIPLYIETLGVTTVQEKVMTMPVTVKKALTTFEDLKTITEALSEAGIKNINYKLTGFTNGGLEGTVPYKVKFEKVVGGNTGYTDFLAYAEEKGIGVYPEFDFSYSNKDAWFDGYSYRKDAVKTIDNRYTQKRTYSATLQAFTSTGQVAISPSVFGKIFDSLDKYVSKLGATGLSVSTLGSDLNSDFDTKEPYNREDSKQFVCDTLAKIREKYGSVWVDGGNSYAIPYADHVTGVSLDSSRFTYASEAIPLYGLVFHGYVNIAGSATNMASDVRYETLKMIENGSYPYFIMVYQNEALLKENTRLNKYYSIAYQIWLEDMIELYNGLNETLSDVMYATIDGHEFLIGERVPTDAEIAEDEAAEKAAAEEKAALEEAERELEEKRQKLEERKNKELGIVVDDETVEDVEDTTEDTTTEDTEDTEDTEEAPEEEGYVYTKYTIDDGSITRTTYFDGTKYIQFICNFNTFAVTVEGHTIEGLSFVKVEAAA